MWGSLWYILGYEESKPPLLPFTVIDLQDGIDNLRRVPPPHSSHVPRPHASQLMKAKLVLRRTEIINAYGSRFQIKPSDLRKTASHLHPTTQVKRQWTRDVPSPSELQQARDKLRPLTELELSELEKSLTLMDQIHAYRID